MEERFQFCTLGHERFWQARDIDSIIKILLLKLCELILFIKLFITKSESSLSPAVVPTLVDPSSSSSCDAHQYRMPLWEGPFP